MNNGVFSILRKYYFRHLLLPDVIFATREESESSQIGYPKLQKIMDYVGCQLLKLVKLGRICSNKCNSCCKIYKKYKG